MRLLGLSLCLCLSIAIFTSSVAEAHVLKQNNGVSVVLHIDPFDAPVANKPTKLETQFGNDTGSFSLDNYKVELTLSENSKAIQHLVVRPAYFGSAAQGLTTITFPHSAVYEVTIDGTPTSVSAPAFSVQYEVRVTGGDDGAAADAGNSGEVLLIGLAIIVVFTMVATKQIMVGKRYAGVSKSKKK